jgi:hypothetical protein
MQWGQCEPRVLWTLKARTGLARNPLVSGEPGNLSRAQVERMLTATFPRRDVIVQDALIGFSPREDHQILLVETVGARGTDSGSYVVKVGPAAVIRKEFENWEACRQTRSERDPVFMPLRPGYPPDGLWREPFAVIVYDDALQFIGKDEQCSCMTLEDAVLGAVRFNSPTIESVLTTLDQLFDRARVVLYPRNPEAAEPGAGSFTPPARRLEDALERWETEKKLRYLRCYLDTHIDRLQRCKQGQLVRRYLGPIPFLRFVLQVAARTPAPAPPPGGALPTVTGVDVIPLLHRGPAHGDFHGRNILVGVMQEPKDHRRAHVRWPAVFDYGHMRRDQYIGMDFVKLETELKVRAYPLIFVYSNPRGLPHINAQEFTRSVHDFEWSLAAQTDKIRRPLSSPAGEDHLGHVARHGLTRDDQLERLRLVILRIRKHAADQLDVFHHRGNWYDEYFFLLCCYGVVPAVYGTYSEFNLLASLLSAGVAAASLGWNRQRFAQELLRVAELAQ